MMETIWFILLGFLMGVISGLGLGGGKILIPALVLFTSTNQAEAQAVTLLSFVPISVIAVITHWKQKNIDWSLVGKVAAGAACGAVVGSFLAMHLPLSKLRMFFGLFLVILGVFELTVKDRVKKRFTS